MAYRIIASWTEWLRFYVLQVAFKEIEAVSQATLNGADRAVKMPVCQPQRSIDHMGITADFDLHGMHSYIA